ncbi:MAG: hypothetical protein J6W38_11850 [Prevotella sp.]|nr:hypothetical protein [Prevotella sp.]
MNNCFKFLLVGFFALISTAVMAQSKTLLISESGLPYTEQTWYAYGVGTPLDESDITSNWNLGKRIVSAAYTKDGWLVVMAKNTGYVQQSFSLTKEWPEEWIAEKTRSGYAITSLSRSESEWLVVMSQGSGITSQIIWRNEWSELAPWITEQKGRGYFLTDLVFDGQAWTLVMSRTPKYTSQGYFMEKSTSELINRIRSTVWDRGFNLHEVVYGEGNYVVVYGNYARGDNRFQNLQVSPDDAKAYIRQQWNRGISIAYVGGGLW